MAGSGRRVFQPGEVLTASNVMNYLQDQAVMNFAGTAARGSAIGTAVAEGMVSYIQDLDQIQVYTGSDWQQVYPAVDVPTAGQIVQVVQTVKTNTFSAAMTLGTFTSAAISASITPKSASNKILVIVDFNMNSNGAGATYAALYRNNSVSNYRGDAASNCLRVTTGSGGGGINLVPMWSSSIIYLDSPATTSAVTYDIRLGASGNQTLYLNRGANDGDTNEFGRGASSITLMEVVA